MSSYPAFTAMMYAIAKKVAKPARNSVRNSDPFRAFGWPEPSRRNHVPTGLFATRPLIESTQALIFAIVVRVKEDCRKSLRSIGMNFQTRRRFDVQPWRAPVDGGLPMVQRLDGADIKSIFWRLRSAGGVAQQTHNGPISGLLTSRGARRDDSRKQTSDIIIFLSSLHIIYAGLGRISAASRPCSSLALQ